MTTDGSPDAGVGGPASGAEAPKRIIHCSFCGKGPTEVTKIIAGPAVYICNECVDLCSDICTENARIEEAIGDFFLMRSKLLIETGPDEEVRLRLEREGVEAVSVQAPDYGDAFWELRKKLPSAPTDSRETTRDLKKRLKSRR